jgi:hypothetical protein
VDQVRLPDLEVIRRYSIAVRREHAPADEVLDALEADVEAIRRAIRDSSRPAPRQAARPAPRKPARPAPRRTAAKPSRSTRSRRRG